MPPQPSKENPGIGNSFTIAFSNTEETWEEEVNLIGSLALVLTEHQVDFSEFESWIELPNSYFLQPQIVALEMLDDGGVKSTTTIEVHHEQVIPAGLFEYQHSAGNDPVEAISEGFRQWAKGDLPVLLDALNIDPDNCSILKMTFPEKSTSRRVILGPVTYYVSGNPDPEEEHPFCPCCFITNNYEAFSALLEDDPSYGIRLFAMRDSEGQISADCRVNGIDYDRGRDALINYAQSWPDLGFEFRKQFVFLHSVGSEN